MKPVSRHVCKPCHVQFNNESGICPSCEADTAINDAPAAHPLDPLCVWLAAQAFTHKCDQIAGGRRRVEKARSGGMSDAFTEALAKVRELFGQNA
jgi:hypothetical protein